MAVDPERRSWTAAHLAQSKFDAVVCSSPTQVLLLTGYWPVMAASVAIATAEGEVRLIIPQDECELASRTTSATIVPYTAGSLDELKDPFQAVAYPLLSQLDELNLSRAKIGLQLRQGVQPASYAVATEFRSSLFELLTHHHPNSMHDSCDDLFQAMEAKKTAVELEMMRRACDIAAAGFAEAERCIQPGRREAEIAAGVHAAFAGTHLAEGLERSYGYFFCMSGPNSAKAAAAYAHTRQRVVEPGDLVMIHANTCADGYWTDITRTYTAGDPSDQQIRMRQAIDEARAAALHTIRPGGTGSDVDHAARSVMQSHGFGPAFKHATGHGVGFAAANANGRPRIHPQSPDVLEQGMTFNVEPAAYFDGYGGMRHCDVVAVTADGAEVMTKF